MTQAQMDAFSTRTVQVHEKERELVRAWQRRHGRAPTSRELLHIANDATLQSRKAKAAQQIDWDAVAERWEATLGGELASIAPAVSNARGPDARAPAHDGVDPGGPSSREAQAQAVAKALVLVSDQHPAWTRHDLLKQLALVMPPETRHMNPAAAQQLLLGLADEAVSGRTGEVVCLEAPEWPPLPESLRRELDGRSVYTRPGTARYATGAQLSIEERLLAHAQAQGAPRLPGQVAARRLSADPALLEAQLYGRAKDACEHAVPRGLRLDQAATVWHVLTSSRTVEIVTGPAGTGKTRVLAAAAHAWGCPALGTATSQNAPNELRAAGVQVAANTTRLLADLTEGRIPPGSLIAVDEGSMVSMAHLSALAGYAARNGCKLVLAGDQEQLAAVEGGGGMMLLADRLGYVQLAEPVRFAAEWERGASLRLRSGDATALDDYDQHGRIRGAPPDQAMDQAARAYVAWYLAGRDVLLMAADWARCRELSQPIRDDLIHLGLVDSSRAVRIAEDAEASAGDLIICRRNDHTVEAGEPGRTLANGDILRIEAITGHGVMARRLLGPDPATGQRRFTEQAFWYGGYRTCDLAYAITGHSAQGGTVQGGTVHTGIALVTGAEDRQWLYPAMTRGTDMNVAFVFTTPVRHVDPRPAPQLDRYDRTRRERDCHCPDCQTMAEPGGPDPREPIAVLAGVLGRDGAELSASQTRQRNLANADHLGTLNAIWTAETRGAQDNRYRDLVHGRAAARLPAAALAPGPVAVPDPARRRTGRPGPRRGHPLGRRLSGPGWCPGHRQRPGRPDPPARLPTAPPAARPVGQPRPPAARSRPARLPRPDRGDDGRPYAAPRPARRPDGPRMADHRARAGPRRPGGPPRLGAQRSPGRRLPRDVRLRPSRPPDRTRTQPLGPGPAGRLAPGLRRPRPGRRPRPPGHARRPTMADPRHLLRRNCLGTPAHQQGTAPCPARCH